MPRNSYDPARLPRKPEGWTVPELAEFFDSPQGGVIAWLSAIRYAEHKGGNSYKKNWQVVRVKAENRTKEVLRVDSEGLHTVKDIAVLPTYRYHITRRKKKNGQHKTRP